MVRFTLEEVLTLQMEMSSVLQKILSPAVAQQLRQYFGSSETILWKGQTAMSLIEQEFPDITMFCTCMGAHTGRCAGRWALVTPGKVEGNCKWSRYLKTKSMCADNFACFVSLVSFVNKEQSRGK